MRSWGMRLTSVLRAFAAALSFASMACHHRKAPMPLERPSAPPARVVPEEPAPVEAPPVIAQMQPAPSPQPLALPSLDAPSVELLFAVAKGAVPLSSLVDPDFGIASVYAGPRGCGDSCPPEPDKLCSEAELAGLLDTFQNWARQELEQGGLPALTCDKNTCGKPAQGEWDPSVTVRFARREVAGAKRLVITSVERVDVAGRNDFKGIEDDFADVKRLAARLSKLRCPRAK
jgi:hypothetical protein